MIFNLLTLTIMKKTHQNINSYISFALFIISLYIVFEKLLYHSNLLQSQNLDIYILSKIISINKDKNFKLIVFYAIVLGFKSLENFIKFLIVRFLSNLC